MNMEITITQTYFAPSRVKVLALAKTGMSIRKISDELKIAKNTVKYHLRNAVKYGELELSTSSEQTTK
jgi:DNA-binding NarL/FixJ family response regulator